MLRIPGLKYTLLASCHVGHTFLLNTGLNLDYLFFLDVDRLLWTFRNNAGQVLAGGLAAQGACSVGLPCRGVVELMALTGLQQM
jgi:hypothetical protein